jgi:FkbM family methyltransferase
MSFSLRSKVSSLILPLTRREVPGWGILFRLFRIDTIVDYDKWGAAPQRTIKGKRHGYQMVLRLSDWSERHTYFLGRYCELATLLILDRVLRPGDRFLDIGANIGMVSLEAARLVGSKGRVDSYEPNPECLQILQMHREMNRISHWHIHPVALADVNGLMTLSLNTQHAGEGTLAPLNETLEQPILQRFDVRTRRGDEIILADDPRPPAMIKIDVEGFEQRVLQGMKTLLLDTKPVILLEYVESHLRRAGSSRRQLHTFLAELGYLGYAVSTKRVGLHHRLRLCSIPNSEATNDLPGYDALWVHADDERRKSIESEINI